MTDVTCTRCRVSVPLDHVHAKDRCKDRECPLNRLPRPEASRARAVFVAAIIALPFLPSVVHGGDQWDLLAPKLEQSVLAPKSASNILRAYAKQQVSTDRECLKPETRAILAKLEAKFGKVEIVSTCRNGAVIRTPGKNFGKPSYHRWGMAVDFKAPPGRKAEVVAWLYAENEVLVMTYRRMTHVHFNTGQGRRFYAGSM